MKLNQPSSLHGNCVQIFGHGILITGKSGIGKSELTLNLLDRGHIFVADDLYQTNPKAKHSTLMHIRDLGVINIATLYPDQILQNSPIAMSIELTNNTHAISDTPTIGDAILPNCPHYLCYANNRNNLALIIETLVKTEFGPIC